MPPIKKRRYFRGAALAFTALAAFVFLPLLFLPSVEGLKDSGKSLEIVVRDWQGREHPFVLGPKNRHWTSLSRMPQEMKWAVVVAEDGRFFEHEGVDYQALKEAIRYDLEKKKMARGASTITQQVAKNVFLSREKTLTRKVREIVLAHRLEQELTKGRILELYLNVVELGPMVHGVGHGARYYFGKPASALTPRECAFLAAMLPGPRVAFNPYRNLRKVEKYADRILRRMRQQGVLSEGEYRQALAGELNIAGLEKKVARTLQSPPPEEVPQSPPADESPGGGEAQSAAAPVDPEFAEGAPAAGEESRNDEGDVSAEAESPSPDLPPPDSPAADLSPNGFPGEPAAGGPAPESEQSH